LLSLCGVMHAAYISEKYFFTIYSQKRPRASSSERVGTRPCTHALPRPRRGALLLLLLFCIYKGELWPFSAPHANAVSVPGTTGKRWRGSVHESGPYTPLTDAHTVRRTVGASTPLQLSIDQNYAMDTHIFRSPFHSSYAHPHARFASSNKCACIDRSPIPS
jgi:hypothetical protein